MERRTLLTAVAGVLVASAGCTSLGSDGDETETASENSTDDETDNESLTESELLEGFEAGLEERGFERIALEAVDDGLELGYDASGTTDDDVATEMELVADGYTTIIEGGSSTTYLEATAFHPADGEVLDYFTIETEWVEAYLDADLEWSELLSRIAETFVSTESADEDDEDDETEDDGDADETDADEDDETEDDENDDAEDDGDSDDTEDDDEDGDDDE